jgi:transposase
MLRLAGDQVESLFDELLPTTWSPSSWGQAIQPLLPTPPRRYGGLPRVDDRTCLAGIVYQLRTGIPWRLLPTRQVGCSRPVTCWRGCGTGSAPACGSCSTSCWSSSAARAGWTGRAPVWSRSACAPSWGLPDRGRTDRPRQPRKQVPPAGRPRRDPAGGGLVSRQHPRLDAAGAAHRCSCAGQGPRGRPGRPRQRPAKLHLDKADDDPRCRRALRAGDHALHRSARGGVQPAAGPPPLGGGAVVGVAGGLPAAAGPLGAARRHPDGVPAAGLRAELPQLVAAGEGIPEAIRRRLGPGGWG